MAPPAFIKTTLLLCLLTAPLAMAEETKAPVIPTTSEPLASPVSVTLHKRTLSEADDPPALQEIMALQWIPASTQVENNQSKILTLGDVVAEWLKHSVAVQEAEAGFSSTVPVGIDPDRAPSFLNPVNLITGGQLRKQMQTAFDAQRNAVEQQERLSAARLYNQLLSAYLEQLQAFETLSEGRIELKTAQQRFMAGEIDRFDVTKAQLKLIAQYDAYLKTAAAYEAAWHGMATMLNRSVETALIPEEALKLEADTFDDTHPPMAAMTVQQPKNLSPEKTEKLAENRPDSQALAAQHELLKMYSQISFGAERQKLADNAEQLDFAREKAIRRGAIEIQRATLENKQAEKSVTLAKQRYNAISRLNAQLQTSHQAGFSSANDVLLGQMALIKAKAVYLQAQSAYRLSQLQLAQSLGLLTQDTLNAI